MATITTLADWTSKYSADSVEWCPIPEFQNIFVCGTYHLQKEDEAVRDSHGSQTRMGELYLFIFNTDTKELKLLQTIKTHAILDQKWCVETIDGCPHLAVANSAGFIQIYELCNDEILQLKFICEHKLNPDKETLSLSIDWYSKNDTKIAVSDSSGCIYIFNIQSNIITKESHWKAHDLEAWICIFDYWNTSVIMTGGDDCTMKAFDTRDNSLIALNKSHEAGVVSLRCNEKVEYLFASGSVGMDEFLKNRDQFRVCEVPPSVHYIPNFISKEEENSLLNCVYSVPKPKWTQLLNRRLQNWGGIPHHNGMIVEPIPKWLSYCIDKVATLNIMDDLIPNHVLINEYLPGQGIMPHTDGSLFYPTITTISCGSHTVIHFKEGIGDCLNEEYKIYSLLLEPRSLLIVQEDMYKNCMHFIEEITCDVVSPDLKNLTLFSKKYNPNEIIERKTRISFTIRHVPKTSKVKIKL